MRENSRCMIEVIAKSIRDAGYDPYTQMYGFLMTGNECYITRTGKARERIKTVDPAELETYLKSAV